MHLTIVLLNTVLQTCIFSPFMKFIALKSKVCYGIALFTRILLLYINDAFFEQGDKLENAEKELKCIVERGCFKLIIKPKKIIYFEKMDSEESVEDHSKVFLNFQAEKFLETWNNEQIDDFVRKLGFLENQTAEDDEQVKLFQQLNQVPKVHNT